MRGCISTSDGGARIALAASLLLLALLPGAARAAPPAETPGTEKSKTHQAEDDDFTSTPFTDYGEFNESAEEAEDTKFFAHGRFFGVSLGGGFQGVNGNRGLLWQGGFPVLDFKVHYWFDFNVALDLNLRTATHYYEFDGEHVDANLLYVGMDVKYYFDTKNLSSAISFANPYLLLGAGSFSKTESNTNGDPADQDSAFGLSPGAGLEFTVRPRKIYFGIEGKMHFVTFKDTFTRRFATVADDLSGSFFTVTGHILFTW